MARPAEKTTPNTKLRIPNTQEGIQPFPRIIQSTPTMAGIRPNLRIFQQPVPLGVVLALWLGSAWFYYNLSIEVPDRIRGDAATYWWLAGKANSLWEVMTSVELRPPGFPTVVYLLKNLATEIGFVWPQILNFMAVFFYLFHLAACLAFFMALRRLAKDNGFNLPFFPLCILFIHPGLISYTTVLLTDTFTVDLLMIGLTLFIWTRWVGQIGKVGLALLSGGILGICALVRVAYGPPIVASLVLFTLIVSGRIWCAHHRGQESRKASRMVTLFIVLIALTGFGLALTPSVLHCHATYGNVCIQKKEETDRWMIWSMINGLNSPRLYWSKFAPPPGRMNLVVDPFLAKHWANTCTLRVESLAVDFAACYLRNPHVGAIFLSKKILAVFDHHYLQPYAVDRTPRWVRLYSRFFGALAFAGFIGAVIIFGIALRWSEWPPEIILITLTTLCIAIFQAQFTVEGRYGFGALVGAYSALAWLWGDRRSRPVLTRKLIGGALGVAAMVFLIQTSYWDSIDPALRVIEQWQ